MFPRVLRLGRRTSRPAAVLLVVLVIAGLVFAGIVVPVASAHANLVESNPANGEQLSSPPDEVVLRYSEGIQLADVAVTTAGGERVNGLPRIDDADRSVVRAPLDGLENGTYVVTWEVLSVDGHTTRGSFFFVVGDEPPTREQLLTAHLGDGGGDGRATDPLEPMLRGTLLVGLAVLVGAPVTLLLVVFPLIRTRSPAEPSTSPAISSTDRTVRLLVGFAILAVVASTTVLALVRMRTAGPVSMDRIGQFAATGLGRAWLAQTATATVLAALALLHVRRGVPSRRTWLGATVVGGLLLSATVAWTGHSAAVTSGAAGALTDFGHLLGASLWVGGLVVLATVVPALVDRADAEPRFAARAIRRFSAIAIAGVALAGATGLVFVAWHVPVPASLSETTYGAALSVKVLLLLLALGLGGLNRFSLHRRLRAADEDRESAPVLLSVLPFALPFVDSTSPTGALVRSVRLELVLLVGVLLVSGFLTSIPTAANAAHQSHEASFPSVESEVDGVTLSFRVVPGEVGPNVFDVQITENGTSVRPDEPVALLLRHPERDVTLPQVELERLDDGTHSTVATVPGGGTWGVRVSAWVDGTYLTVRHSMTVPPADGGHGHESGTRMTYGEYLREQTFERYLGIGALAVALAGVVALGRELVLLRYGR